MPGKRTAKKSEIEVKKTEKKTAPKTERSEVSPSNASWEKRLLEVYGGTVMLRYRPIEPGMVTTEHELSPTEFPLQKGVTIEPGSMGAQVSSAFMSASDSRENVIYTALGGQVTLQPPNLEDVTVTGELATVNIVSTDAPAANNIDQPDTIRSDWNQQEAARPDNIALPALTLSEMQEQKLPGGTTTTEISAYLKASVVIRPMIFFRFELGEGEYIKHSNDADPKLTFWKTRLTYKNQLAAPAFETEIDSSGFHISGDDSVKLDAEVISGSDLTKQHGDGVPLHMVIDDAGAHIEARPIQKPEPEQRPEEPRNDYLVIGGVTFYLENIRREDGMVVGADRASCVHNGFEIKLTEVVIGDQQSKLTGKTEELTRMTGKGTITCDSLSFDAATGFYAQQATFTQEDQEYFLESVRFDIGECIRAEQAQGLVEGYRTTMHDALFETNGTLSYQQAEVLTVLHYGLNKEKEDEYNENAQNFFAFGLENGTVSDGKFAGGTTSSQTASQEKTTIVDVKSKTKQKTVVIDREIFTEDGFVQLEDAVFDFQKDADADAGIRGKGKFKFLAIPYSIALSGNRKVEGKTQAKDDAEEDALEFTIGESGNLDAEFEDDVELNLLKASNGTENLIRSLQLSKVAIKDSMLTAEKVRLDRGINFEQSVEEASESEIAQKLFGGEIKGTISRSGRVNQLDREGIRADALESHLGKFGVSGFLGFLDAEGDYPAGKLHVGLKKETEKEGDQTKLFGSVASDIVTDDGLNIPIAGPLAFQFSISPSVSIGGELSADLDRGKSFGERMEPSDSMKLEGEMKAEGKGSLGLSAGLAIGVPVITNLAGADVKLSAELEAAIKASLKAKTALGKPQEALKQTEDLEMSGKVDAGLSGTVSLSSDVKFLIWKAQVFKIELFKKEVKLTPFSGTAKRDKDARGLREGWHFESLDLSADAFGKKAFLALRNAEKEPSPAEKLKMSKEAAESMGEEVSSAWTVLQELKEQQTLSKERAYIISEEEKHLLDSRIKSMTATVRKKLEDYSWKLNRYVDDLEIEANEAEREVKNAREMQSNYQNADAVRQATLRNTAAGGFSFENYKLLTEADLQKNDPKKTQNQLKKELDKTNTDRKKMASIDFAIARVLGIYNNAMNSAKDSYDFFAQKQNLKILARNQKIREDNQKNGTNIKEEELYARIKDMSERDFLFTKHKFWGTGMDEMEAMTTFGHFDYFKSLYRIALNENRGRKISGFGTPYEPIFQCKPDLSGLEFLKIVLSDRYPEGVFNKKKENLSGKVIGATPEQKMKAFQYVFHEKSKEDKVDQFLDRLMGFETKEKNRKKDMVADADKVYNTLFQSNLEHMTKTGDVNMEEKLQELDQNLAASKENYLKALKIQLEATAALETVKNQIKDCQDKLRKLDENVKLATTLKGNAVSGATAAVNFVQNEYSDIASTRTLTDTVVKASSNGALQREAQRIQQQVGDSSGRAVSFVMPPVNRG